MGNNLNISLEGKYVILDRGFYSGETDLERMFYCVSGFGCSPETSGRAIFGHFTIDAEETRIEGYQVKRLATKEEIAQAKYPKPFTEKEKLSRHLVMLIEEKAKIEKKIAEVENQLNDCRG
jgi:hypothetical protein